MSKNVGTLISAAIRPIDSNDTIATAYATEVRGGLHTSSSSIDRDNIIFERREWGMMCYVVTLDKTYQLKYNLSSTNILDNNNWVEFSGSGGGNGGGEWIDSVISVLNIEPLSPSNGDRYMLGNSPSGTNWLSLQSGLIVQWNSTLSKWDETTPTDGMSVRVDNEDNSVYKYETYGGLYPFPLGSWNKEKLGQIRDLSATTINGSSYSSTTTPYFNSYVKDMLFLTKFSTTNTGSTVSVNINSLGQVYVKKPTSTGLKNLNPLDIKSDVIYNLIYDGTYFQLHKPYTNEDVFNVKYYIEPTDYIFIPQNYQYWVYSDLTIDGTLVNYGQIVIANGGLVLGASGSFNNNGLLSFVNFSGSGMTPSYNDSLTIQFTQSNTVFGPSVSAIVKDGSLTASKLDTGVNGGATAGYILSVDSNGQFSWLLPTTSTSQITYDDKNFIMTQTSIGDGFFTGLTISNSPLGYVTVFINGIESDLGYGSTSSSSCYFSDDGGVTAKSIGSISIGDGLYWNNSISGFVLNTDLPDRISLNYLI